MEIHDVHDEYGDEYEEYEVEEVADDTPMHIRGRVFLGSIDAARNDAALTRARIGVAFALLGAADERVAQRKDNNVERVLVVIEDSVDEPLFERLPALLAALRETLADAEKREHNVLVHCMAGRSRSPALVAAWMMASHSFTLTQALDRMMMIRPWIEINQRFQRDLELWNRVTRFHPQNESPDTELKLQLAPHRDRLPHLDFGESLVADILVHNKSVTMRLVSDIQNDRNSDLQRTLQFSTVVATTASPHDASTRVPFAFLRIDRVDSEATLASIDDAVLGKTGFSSKAEVLGVLKTFYPDVTMQTPLLLLSFTCLCRSE